MNSSVSLLAIIVALCLGHVVSRGIETEQKKTFSAKLEIIRPQRDCIRSIRANISTSGCDVNLFGTKDVQLENFDDKVYVMGVEIGKSKQKFKVMVDTGSDVLWVFGEECKDTDPLCKDHRKFKVGESTTFKDEKRELKIKYVKGEVFGEIGRDNVFITDGLEAKEQLFGTASKVDLKYNGFDGILGINMLKTIGEECATLKALNAAGMDPIVSLYLKGEEEKDGGEITFGGLNEALYEKGLGIRASVLEGGHFTIKMDKVKFGDTVICTHAGPVSCKAHVDSGASVIIGPKTEIDEFNLKVLEVKDTKEYKIVDCKGFEDFPEITINLSGKLLKLDSSDYIEPEAFTKDCYSLLRGRDVPQVGWILGLPLLRKYYTEFNMEKYPKVVFHPLK